jgi:hypothetical protein
MLIVMHLRKRGSTGIWHLENEMFFRAHPAGMLTD